MEIARPTWDLVKSIDSEDENIPVGDSSSESEEEFQPKQFKKNQTKVALPKDFNQDFKFVDSVGDYNADPWKDDIHKFIKRKAKSKTDDKLAKNSWGKRFYIKFTCTHFVVWFTLISKGQKNNDSDDDIEDGDALSEDELK